MQPIALVVVFSLLVLVDFYRVFIRPLQLRWSATDDEVKRSCMEMTLSENHPSMLLAQ